jgi:hypothetical protein
MFCSLSISSDSLLLSHWYQMTDSSTTPTLSSFLLKCPVVYFIPFLFCTLFVSVLLYILSLPTTYRGSLNVFCHNDKWDWYQKTTSSIFIKCYRVSIKSCRSAGLTVLHYFYLSSINLTRQFLFDTRFYLPFMVHHSFPNFHISKFKN